jgi:YfiH family protein
MKREQPTTLETFTPFDQIAFGFGTRGEPIPSALLPYWQSRPAWKQVHQKNIVEVKASGEACFDTDGLWTAQKQIPIAVVTADCVPILFLKKNQKEIGAVHAGWRGTHQKIGPEFFSLKGEKPGDWAAIIGPSIRGCCYSVSQEIVTQFEAITPGDSSRWLSKKQDQPFIDLGIINQIQLEDIGLHTITSVNECTRCSLRADGQLKYLSYRAGDLTSRQYSGLVLL